MLSFFLFAVFQRSLSYVCLPGASCRPRCGGAGCLPEVQAPALPKSAAKVRTPGELTKCFWKKVAVWGEKSCRKGYFRGKNGGTHYLLYRADGADGTSRQNREALWSGWASRMPSPSGTGTVRPECRRCGTRLLHLVGHGSHGCGTRLSRQWEPCLTATGAVSRGNERRMWRGWKRGLQKVKSKRLNHSLM
jgi:hypothetical protein